MGCPKRSHSRQTRAMDWNSGVSSKCRPLRATGYRLPRFFSIAYLKDLADLVCLEQWSVLFRNNEWAWFFDRRSNRQHPCQSFVDWLARVSPSRLDMRFCFISRFLTVGQHLDVKSTLDIPHIGKVRYQE
ncbi:hypothetical protein VTK73DRAFT_8145 [Phialemonium thermophilum]|uniref:Uncharacterized protein n=1 Tax=Phialemonium thermophilum TaxID=223376 RepID=A0ABR3WB06_9PEZI